jgi:DNA-binding transcriptional LysR family regulator
MAIDQLMGMRVFTAVVEAGSFAGAADKLDLSRGMATRYVAQLEAHLGVRLLNRTTRKLSLTTAGADYYQRSTQVLALIAEAESSAARDAAVPCGTLRITAPVIFGGCQLVGAISDYLRRYPAVQVDLSINERIVDLVEEGFDLAVRVARQVDPGLITRQLTRSRTLLCAAPSYLMNHPAPQSPEELANHNCLFYPHSLYRNQWLFMRDGERHAIRISGNLRAGNGQALVNAAVQGLGVILEPDFLVDEALQQKRLLRLLPDWETGEISVFLVWPNRKFLPPRVRSFIDFLAERFAPRTLDSGKHAQDCTVAVLNDPGQSRWNQPLQR